jgi:hypothetical protein
MQSGSKPPTSKQFYVAVGSPDVKLATLVDLLQALQAIRPIGVAVLVRYA